MGKLKPMEKNHTTRSPSWALVNIIEPQRKVARLSIRAAAERAGTSESNWRQLRDGGVPLNGQWIERTPRRDQVLDFAVAVGCVRDVAEAIDATEDEVTQARRRVIVPDPAEERIMKADWLNNREKLTLIEALTELRKHG